MNRLTARLRRILNATVYRAEIANPVNGSRHAGRVKIGMERATVIAGRGIRAFILTFMFVIVSQRVENDRKPRTGGFAMAIVAVIFELLRPLLGFIDQIPA